MEPLGLAGAAALVEPALAIATVAFLPHHSAIGIGGRQRAAADVGVDVGDGLAAGALGMDVACCQQQCPKQQSEQRAQPDRAAVRLQEELVGSHACFPQRPWRRTRPPSSSHIVRLFMLASTTYMKDAGWQFHVAFA